MSGEISETTGKIVPKTIVTAELVEELSAQDLRDLCDAMEANIDIGSGFGWNNAPARENMERYFKGVLLVPERHLIVTRIDGIICGALQLSQPNRHNEAQAFNAELLASFVAPWARGYGAGRLLSETAENLALEKGFSTISLNVRETQTAAIKLYEKLGYQRWGTNPHYAIVEGKVIAGHHYSKTIARTFRVDNVETLLL